MGPVAKKVVELAMENPHFFRDMARECRRIHWVLKLTKMFGLSHEAVFQKLVSELDKLDEYEINIQITPKPDWKAVSERLKKAPGCEGPSASGSGSGIRDRVNDIVD